MCKNKTLDIVKELMFFNAYDDARSLQRKYLIIGIKRQI